METSLITYNLRDRGRTHRGKERHFNIRAIVDAVNSAACQERVGNRDMQGYYGHWPRLKFGMNPQEGGLDSGRPALVEPALITTHLKADGEGNIEHKAEFLDTTSGHVAAKLYQNRTGGFSSAIDQGRPEFFGFDYVLEPNYATNRGWTFDDVSGMTLDDIEAAIYDEQLRGMMRMLDSATSERDRMADTIAHLSEQNEQLLSVLVARTGDESAAHLALDAASIMPVAMGRDPAERIQRDARAFRAIRQLPETVPPPAVITTEDERAYTSLRSRLFGGR